MALDNNTIGYLLDPAFQVEGIAGKPAVGGHIEVFLAGTDSKYISFSNFDGTKNPFKIPLSNDGRAVVLANASQSYDVYFYDSFNNLMFSRLNVFPDVAGDPVNINGYYTRIKNTDDTLDITVTGSMVGKNDYTINTNHIPLGVEEPLYWKEEEEDGAVIAVDLTSLEDKVAEAVIERVGDLAGRLDQAESDISSLEATKQDKLSQAQLNKIDNAVDAAYVQAQDVATKNDIMSNVYTKEETRTKITEGVNTGKADILSKVYTQTQTDDKLATKANSSDVYTKSSVYTKEEVDNKLSDKVTSTQLNNAVAPKANSADVYTKTQTDSAISASKTLIEADVDDKLEDYAKLTDISGKMDTSLLTIDDGKITAYNNIPFAGQGGGDVTKAYVDEQIAAVNDEILDEVEDRENADTALGQRIDGKQDTLSESQMYNINNAITSLTNYYTKNETYSKEEVDAKIADFGGFRVVTGDSEGKPVVEQPSTKLIYLVKATEGKPDNYKEWIYDTNWVLIGDTTIDLTGYAKTSDLSVYALKSEIPTVPTNVSAFTNDAGYLTEHQDISGLATKAELDDYALKTEIPVVPTNVSDFVNDAGYLTQHQDISGKQDKLTAGANISISSDNTISVTGQLGKIYSGQNGVSVDNTNDKIGLDSDTYSTVSKFNNAKELVGGDNVTITETDDNVVIAFSGTIDAYTKSESDAKYQTKLTDYTPSVWNAKQDAITFGTIEV